MQYSIFFFIIGSVVGSFLNVCIHRLPRGESIVWPASHCPACGRALSPLDLVPLLSYLLLRGRCRYCGGPISVRYPLVELLTGSFFAWSFLRFGWSVELGLALALVSLLLAAFFIDLEQMVVPDVVSGGGIVLGLAYNAYLSWRIGSPGPFYLALLALLAGYALLGLIGLLGKALFKKEAMGEGDLLLGALLGSTLGLSGVLLAVFLSYLFAGAISLALMVSGRLKLGDYLPFGPALAAGGLLTLFFGARILAWYSGLFRLY